MRTYLTKVEQLDGKHPGLADDVKKWFCQGVPASAVPPLLLEKYHVTVAARTVGSFRTVRWVPEQKLLRDKKIEERARLEVAFEQQIRASMATPLFGVMK